MQRVVSTTFILAYRFQTTNCKPKNIVKRTTKESVHIYVKLLQKIVNRTKGILSTSLRHWITVKQQQLNYPSKSINMHTHNYILPIFHAFPKNDDRYHSSPTCLELVVDFFSKNPKPPNILKAPLWCFVYQQQRRTRPSDFNQIKVHHSHYTCICITPI